MSSDKFILDYILRRINLSVQSVNRLLRTLLAMHLNQMMYEVLGSYW